MLPQHFSTIRCRQISTENPQSTLSGGATTRSITDLDCDSSSRFTEGPDSQQGHRNRQLHDGRRKKRVIGWSASRAGPNAPDGLHGDDIAGAQAQRKGGAVAARFGLGGRARGERQRQ